MLILLPEPLWDDIVPSYILFQNISRRQQENKISGQCNILHVGSERVPLIIVMVGIGLFPLVRFLSFYHCLSDTSYRPVWLIPYMSICSPTCSGIFWYTGHPSVLAYCRSCHGRSSRFPFLLDNNSQLMSRQIIVIFSPFVASTADV